MTIKKFNDSPTISDQIIFDILTPDINGCFLSNPYKVDKVSIYFIERDFATNNYGQFTQKIYDEKLLEKINFYKKLACEFPGQYLDQVNDLQNKLDASVVKQDVFYSDVRLVAEFGNEEYPAWLSTDTENASITNIPFDANGNVQYGRFVLEWSPVGIREGDFFIVWSWTFFPADVPMSHTLMFNILGDTKLTTTLPTHFTKPEKYETLLDRYTPSVIKTQWSFNDLTPPVVDGLNKSVAKGFTFLEDMANQMLDMIDANVTHEGFLVLLSNLFNLKLRSSDPTLWRRQIKNAVPLFKKKGTIPGLIEALAQAGVFMTKFTKLWQVQSKYTWQEHFTVVDEQFFKMSHEPILPIDPNHFEVYYRGVDDAEWSKLTPDYVYVEESDGNFYVYWQGNLLSMQPIELSTGDSIRVVYQIHSFPNYTEELLDTYIRTLPISDTRDERLQDYPIKNWNTRLIEEDDPLFNLVITKKHPYYDPIIYGKVRTEFPYSENIYNMEEYNGSIRDSVNPCDIDKEFVDYCSSCQSSKFNISVDVENLSSDRIIEAREIINEFMPFHALLHDIQISGLRNDIVQPPIEEIQLFAHIKGTEIVISGSAQQTFGRIMEEGKSLLRNELAKSVLIAEQVDGNLYNSNISLFSPDARLDDVGLDEEFSLLEILGSHPNAGSYQIANVEGNHGEVASAPEPINQTPFTFRLSNERLRNNTATINQSNIFLFADDAIILSTLPIRTTWDVNHDSLGGGAWKVAIPSFSDTYTIANILPSGELVLDDVNNTIPPSNAININFTILDDNDVVIHSSNLGKLNVINQAIVDLSFGANLMRNSIVVLDDITSVIQKGFYVEINNVQYKVVGFVEDELLQVIIEGYSAGDSASEQIVIYHRLIDNQIGYFHYLGLNLQTVVNYEKELHIVNGTNPPSRQPETNLYKENFLINIDGVFYAIADIDGTHISLNGPAKDWTTLGNGGTATKFDILKFKKTSFSIEERNEKMDDETIVYAPGAEFDKLDRRGKEIITKADTSIPEVFVAALNEDSIIETLEQQESITFTIKWADDE